MARRPGNTLEKWEVALVKTMLARKFVPQDIQAYFSRPTRSINHARISEIRDGAKHRLSKLRSTMIWTPFSIPGRTLILILACISRVTNFWLKPGRQ